MPRKKKTETEAQMKTMPQETPRSEKVYIIDKAELQKKQTLLNPEVFDVATAAAKLVMTEKQNYDDDNRGIKETMKRAFKNYLGVYDEPYDPYTGRKKIFSPLTHNIVDSVSKPVSVDSRSIKILPLDDESRGKAKILNMVLPYYLKLVDFDAIMDDLKQRLVLFGTQVSVTDWLYEEVEVANDDEASVTLLRGFAYKIKDNNKTRIVKTDRPRIRLVPIMDMFIPATAESLSWACRNASVIIRSVQPLDDITRNPAYDDNAKADLKGFITENTDVNDSSSLNRYATAGFSTDTVKQQGTAVQMGSQNPMVTVYERYGMIPKTWITGEQKEGDEMVTVPAIITCASDDNGGSMKTLSVRLSPFGVEGCFEEAWLNKIPNRFFGEGIGERLVPLQTWHNEVLNSRRNNELLVQNRMFIYRKGKVDPRQFLSRPGGGIAVEEMTDVQWIPTPDVNASSFNEDAAIESSAQRLAGVAMTPVQKKATATEINNIQANANLTYNELRTSLERFVERWVSNQLLPLLQKYFTQKQIVPIDLGMKEMDMLDTYNGYAPMKMEELENMRFLMIDDKALFDGNFAVTCDIEGGSVTRAQQVAALTNGMSIAMKFQQPMFNMKFALRKMMELSGIVDDRLFEDSEAVSPNGMTNPMLQGMQQMMRQGAGQPQPAQAPEVGV